MPKLTPQQALLNLYNASTKAHMTKDDHTLCSQSAALLSDIINANSKQAIPETKEDKAK